MNHKLAIIFKSKNYLVELFLTAVQLESLFILKAARKEALASIGGGSRARLKCAYISRRD